MFFKRAKEKELKMIWEVEKNTKRSFLVGTAHFFPYSFRNSLSRHIKNARTVMFEGPLDKDSMDRVREAGYEKENTAHLFDALDRQTIERLSVVLFPARRYKKTAFMNPFTLEEESPAYTLIKGMKPWLAFFTIWSHYLEKNGWRYSVDYEGYCIAKEMGKAIVFLESIEEQVKVLESLSHERIVHFLTQSDHWDDYTKAYVKEYLSGNLDRLKSIGVGFPSRHHAVIDRRDLILFERMFNYLEQGDAVTFVGAPHIHGISRMLRREGFQIKGPPIPFPE